jgi:integrase
MWAVTYELSYPVGPLVRMLMLTGQRRGEVAGARWREFDLSNRVWTIPAERFKSDATHVVPLANQVIELLSELPRWASSDLLFSATGGRSAIKSFDRSKSRLDEALGNPSPTFVLHDIRRTVRTRLSELRVQDHIAEMIIGHARRGLARVYDLYRYQTEMAEALQAWADHLGRIVLSK